MYPPHLNYATTLPRKTLTVKITIFTGGGVCSAREVCEGLFADENNFSLFNIKMIVFALLARKKMATKVVW